jgi:hypothetical protein
MMVNQMMLEVCASKMISVPGFSRCHVSQSESCNFGHGAEVNSDDFNSVQPVDFE